ncbi:hypothetical protein BDV26DRAFT_286095 [Aspergillus bertholletiae]|uniref:Xylanolytic transcriptional activator regulatory domain-containing protein n=1 Tax=Aspergillus bertholletiae TaxID=1226010 RepID=A0A5N7AQX8_9EURO|nr:hypothetical protein BDV26DRAFT_286095 [Aspergillus bertholletiae]
MPEDVLPARNCANCVDAGVPCQRLRPGRASKQKFSPRLPEEGVFRLERATSELQRMSKGEHLDVHETIPPGESARELFDMDIPPTPPAELLYMLLPEPVMSNGLHHQIRWPDHISDKAFERMMTSLLDGDCRGQLFYQYSICVYVKAMFHLYQLVRRSTNPAVKKQLQKSKKTYEAAALQALKHINIMSTPSLSLIQALISAALLMQHTTNISQCWLLNSYAARQIISLNYHRPCYPPSPSGCNDEIQSALYWCFYLDRTTSALLMRHPSLLELPAPPTGFTSSNPSSPYNKLLFVLLDLAKVQGTLLDITLNDGDKSRSRIFEIFQGVQERMDRVYSSLQETRGAISGPALYDWVAADFSYYAIYVDMLRTRLGYDGSPATHSDCLVYSRRALRAFQYLQEHADHMPGFNDPEPSFLTWTIALYPAAPFFVVFCNIIATSDESDYRLVQRIIKGLSQYKATPYLARLLNLLKSLLQLCDPLFENMGNASRQPHLAGDGHSSTDAPHNPVSNHTTSAPAFEPELAASLDQQLSAGSYSMYMNAGLPDQGAVTASYPMADDLMWQLVNSQFPSSWLESEAILDLL